MQVHIVKGEAKTLHAHEFDVHGSATTGLVQWVSTDTAVCVVEATSTDTQSATIRAVGNVGNAGEVQATSNNKVGSATVIVDAAAVDSVTITE